MASGICPPVALKKNMYAIHEYPPLCKLEHAHTPPWHIINIKLTELVDYLLTLVFL